MKVSTATSSFSSADTMMDVQLFLRGRAVFKTNLEAIHDLTETFSIKAKFNDDLGLVLLDYDQINSPKTINIVIECRSLILDIQTFDVVSRKFDRFFNLGENESYYHDFDLARSRIVEKADGSLIGVYKHRDKVHISTRGTIQADAEHPIHGTFRQGVMKTMGLDEDSLQRVFSPLQEGETVVMEWISPDNRIVTPYTRDEMVLLSVNNGIRQTDYRMDWWAEILKDHNVRRAKTYGPFATLADVRAAVDALPDLQEGMVIYDPVSAKRMKVKAEAYVAVHHLRGENGTPTDKNILQLLLTNEQDEFLSYFPEFKDRFDAVRDIIVAFRQELVDHAAMVKYPFDQKEFAFLVKDNPLSAILFKARKESKTPTEVFDGLDINTRMKYLKGKL